MKKSILFLGSIGILSLCSMTLASAENLSASSNIGFDVSSPNGKLEVISAKPLTFGNIEYSTKEQVVYPYIEHIEQYVNSFHSNYINTTTGIVAGYGGENSIIDISDSRIGSGKWELFMKLSDAVNNETGSSFPITLQLRDFVNVLDSDPSISSYRFISSRTMETPVYSGSQGAYALSLLNDMRDIRDTPRAPAPKPPQTTDWFALVIPANTKVDKEGAYSATINWTLSDKPGAIPVK